MKNKTPRTPLKKMMFKALDTRKKDIAIAMYPAAIASDIIDQVIGEVFNNQTICKSIYDNKIQRQYNTCKKHTCAWLHENNILFNYDNL